MGLLTNKGLVRMKKGDVEHNFVLESVPVWEKRGWNVVEAPEEKNKGNERLRKLNEAAQKELAELDAQRDAQQTTSKGK